MGFVKTVKNGAELTHPHLSLWWIVGAIVAIFLLLVAFAISKWGFNKVAAPVSAAVGNLPAVGSSGTNTTDAAGWIY
jgi:hypothetical protein